MTDMNQEPFALIFFDVRPGHGDLEPDVLVFRAEDHAAGTVQWRARPAQDPAAPDLYDRRVFSTPAWQAQVRADLREVIAEQFGVTDVTFTRWDGDDW